METSGNYPWQLRCPCPSVQLVPETVRNWGIHVTVHYGRVEGLLNGLPDDLRTFTLIQGGVFVFDSEGSFADSNLKVVRLLNRT